MNKDQTPHRTDNTDHEQGDGTPAIDPKEPTPPMVQKPNHEIPDEEIYELEGFGD